MDAVIRATKAAGNKAQPLVEIGTPMTGDLFKLDAALR